MNLKIYTVYDSKAGFFEKPLFMRSNGEAIRAFETIANDPEHSFCKFAGDYTMFEIGEWDNVNGTITMLDAKVNLGNALQYKKAAKEELSLPFPGVKREPADADTRYPDRV